VSIAIALLLLALFAASAAWFARGPAATVLAAYEADARARAEIEVSRAEDVAKHDAVMREIAAEALARDAARARLMRLGLPIRADGNRKQRRAAAAVSRRGAR
jgi:hypothetical protein